MFEQKTRCTFRHRHGRNSGSHGLHDRVAGNVVVWGIGENIHSRDRARKRFSIEIAGKFSILQIVSQPRALRSLPNNQKTERSGWISAKRTFEVGKKIDVALR